MPLPLALASLAVLTMLVAAILAYTVPSARGDVLRSPEGHSTVSTWNEVQ